MDACIRGVHVGQLDYPVKHSATTAVSVEGRVPESMADDLESAFNHIVSVDARQVVEWADTDSHDMAGVGTATDHLNAAPLKLPHVLPVMAMIEYMKRLAPGAEPAGLCAVANLHQVVLEVERDATVAQSLFSLYRDLGLPLNLAQLGIQDENEDLDHYAADLADRACACPYDTTRPAWRLALQKVKNWGEQYAGIYSAETYAEELITLPDIAECEDAIRRMPAQVVCILGHSFTQSRHWSTHASFTDIAAAIVEKWNSGITFPHIGENNLDASEADGECLDRLFAYRPQCTLIVVAVRNGRQMDALLGTIPRLREQGSRVCVFDSIVHGFGSEQSVWHPRVARKAGQAGAEVIEVKEMLAAHPRRAEFEALDIVHMTPVYHKVMAVEWTRFLCGLRSDEGIRTA